MACGGHLDGAPVDLDPAGLAAEPVVAGDPGERAWCRPASRRRCCGRPVAWCPTRPGRRRCRGRCHRATSPLAEGRHHLEGQGSHRHVHPVQAELAVGPHGRVPAPPVDDGEGLGGPEVRVDPHAGHHQQVAGVVLAGEPHPLVGPGVRGPHHPHRHGDGCGRGTRRAPTSDGARCRRRRGAVHGPAVSPDPVDGLQLDVLLQAGLAPLAPDPRGSVAAEGGQGIRGVAVDAEGPGADPAGHGQAPGGVGGPHRPGQPVLGVVGDRTASGVVVVGDDAEDGAEDLLPGDPHGVVHVGEDRRADEPADGQPVRGRAPPDHQPGAVRGPAVDVRRGPDRAGAG